MALQTVSDYQTALNGLLYYLDNEFSGLDRVGIPRVALLETEDWLTILAAYKTYKTSRKSYPAAKELFPTAHGTNHTTFQNG
jgi:hypothetical protein